MAGSVVAAVTAIGRQTGRRGGGGMLEQVKELVQWENNFFVLESQHDI